MQTFSASLENFDVLIFRFFNPVLEILRLWLYSENDLVMYIHTRMRPVQMIEKTTITDILGPMSSGWSINFENGDSTTWSISSMSASLGFSVSGYKI